MHFSKPLLFLVIFLFLYQAGVAQISQGTLVFKDESLINWTAFDSILVVRLNEIDQSDKSEEEKEEEKAEWRNFIETMIPMLKEQKVLAANDSTIYIFNKEQAVAQRMDGGKLRDEFWIYNLDSMQVAIHSIHSIQGGKHHKRVITSTPEAASVNWINIRDSVVVDSNDVKTILGFRCVKHYLFHSHAIKFNAQNIEKFQYELYVTDAIIFPFYIMEHEITSPVFSGCALEIKRIDSEYKPFTFAMKATSFSRQVDTSKFVLPEKFKE